MALGAGCDREGKGPPVGKELGRSLGRILGDP